MKRIYKYPFPIQVESDFVIHMPVGAKILTVQLQNGDPYIWAIVDPAAEICARSFLLFGTGNPLPTDITALPYIGTFQLRSGSFVFHLFEGIA